SICRSVHADLRAELQAAGPALSSGDGRVPAAAPSRPDRAADARLPSARSGRARRRHVPLSGHRPGDYPRTAGRGVQCLLRRRRGGGDLTAAAQDDRAAPDGRALMSERFASGVVSDLVARAIVIILFSLMSANLFSEYLRTGHVTGLMLLVSESLVVVLTIVRRRTSLVDRSAEGVIATAVSLAGPPLVRAYGDSHLLPDAATAIVSAVGVMIVITGKMALGRSFGIAPANRGV